jgi:hypothetical protein
MSAISQRTVSTVVFDSPPGSNSCSQKVTSRKKANFVENSDVDPTVTSVVTITVEPCGENDPSNDVSVAQKKIYKLNAMSSDVDPKILLAAQIFVQDLISRAKAEVQKRTFNSNERQVIFRFITAYP